jgi:hypothetical protein
MLKEPTPLRTLQFAPLPVKQPRLKPAAAPYSVYSSPWFYYGVVEYCLTDPSSPYSYSYSAGSSSGSKYGIHDSSSSGSNGGSSSGSSCERPNRRSSSTTEGSSSAYGSNGSNSVGSSRRGTLGGALGATTPTPTVQDSIGAVVAPKPMKTVTLHPVVAARRAARQAYMQAHMPSESVTLTAPDGSNFDAYVNRLITKVRSRHLMLHALVSQV